VTRRIVLTALAVFIAFFTSLTTTVHAQPPAATAQATEDPQAATPTPPPADDDDAKLRPLEPDFSLVNLPTTLPLPVHAGDFHLTHRFNENLRNDSFGTQASNFFGLDEGATIQLEYRFGVMKHLEAIVSRTNVQRDIQFSAKYDAFHESASHPIGLSAIVGVEGTNNFKENYAPALGVVVSRTIANVAAVYVTPIWAHNTFPGTGVMENTFYVGLGARVRIVPSLYVVGEMSPRVGGYTPGDAEYAFSLEKRVGAHVFSVTFANTAATTYGQIARGGNPESLYLGFNLARKFF
jgi:Membrane bound beta barrel domain (DUF5777)